MNLNPMLASFAIRASFLTLALFIFSANAQADDSKHAQAKVEKSFTPGKPWHDTNGKLINAHGFCVIDYQGQHYWYGSQKIPGKTENEKNEAGVSCYTSKDLIHWEDQGLVLSVFAPGAPIELANAYILDRPKVIHHVRSGKFLMYFKLYPPLAEGGKSGKDYAYVGVATAEKPLGAFTYQGRFLGANSKFGTGDFAIYVDQAGEVFHICVRKPDKILIYGRMTADGLKPEGDYQEMAGITKATEAPALFRRGLKLYLLGSASTGWAANPARMFVADQLSGPWKPLPNPCEGINPHNQLGAHKTFGGQSTYVYPVAGKERAWIAMFDINSEKNPFHSPYIWLPLEFDEKDRPVIRWRNRWDMSVFSRQ
jgi:hypothetical protein